MKKQFYTMKELGELIPIGTTNLYNLVHTQGFPAIIINRKILIPIDAFDDWVTKAQGKIVKIS